MGNVWVQPLLQIFLWTSHKQMARGSDVQEMSQEQTMVVRPAHSRREDLSPVTWGNSPQSSY